MAFQIFFFYSSFKMRLLFRSLGTFKQWARQYIAACNSLIAEEAEIQAASLGRFWSKCFFNASRLLHKSLHLTNTSASRKGKVITTTYILSLSFNLSCVSDPYKEPAEGLGAIRDPAEIKLSLVLLQMGWHRPCSSALSSLHPMPPRNYMSLLSASGHFNTPTAIYRILGAGKNVLLEAGAVLASTSCN